MRYDGQHAAVVGGSVGGLTAALLLRELGFTVDVFERTPGELDGRGGGIVVQPETVRWFKERSRRRPDQLTTVSRYMRVLGADGIEFEEPVEWRFTSWSTLYRALLSDFGREHYHLGHYFVGLDQTANTVNLRFANGATAAADLAVFADGITSVARKRLLPDDKLTYSGYIGWRGTVPEGELSDSTRAVLGDSLTYSFGDRTHICMYPIPGPDGETAVGDRLMNYVWYRNIAGVQAIDEVMTDKSGIRGEVSVHPGKVQDRFVAEMREGAGVLGPAAAELVRTTAQPYIQPILDFRAPQMVFGRVVMIGDAAFVARPHAAAGTAKAAAEAWNLADALEQCDDGDIDSALRAWEPHQIEVGNALLDRIELMGRAAQVDNTWNPHDRRLRFGLLEGALQPAY